MLTVFWGIVAFLVGVFIAAQLVWPQLNFDIEHLTFGRLRPLHTSAAIFAFGGNALIGTGLLRRPAHLPAPGCSAARRSPGSSSGATSSSSSWPRPATCWASPQGREYAEPEWYVDLWLTIVWVAYLIVFLGTLLKREEPHIYVANWFYLAFIVTIAMLHVVNNLSVPVSFFGTKSYSPGRGVQDAHDPVVVRPQRRRLLPHRRLPRHDVLLHPEAAERPVYSYRLSIVHFWSLIFLYIWAGPHHLHYTALPDWAQTLGMVVLGHAVDAVLGRHDQRPHDAVGRLGQAAHRSRSCASRSPPSASTACRPSRGR